MHSVAVRSSGSLAADAAEAARASAQELATTKVATTPALEDTKDQAGAEDALAKKRPASTPPTTQGQKKKLKIKKPPLADAAGSEVAEAGPEKQEAPVAEAKQLKDAKAQESKQPQDAKAAESKPGKQPNMAQETKEAQGAKQAPGPKGPKGAKEQKKPGEKKGGAGPKKSQASAASGAASGEQEEDAWRASLQQILNDDDVPLAASILLRRALAVRTQALRSWACSRVHVSGHGHASSMEKQESTAVCSGMIGGRVNQSGFACQAMPDVE
jgi:hypothetical protein